MRVLAFVEALSLTGVARNLLQTFSYIDLRIATYRRRAGSAAHHRGVSVFVTEAEARGVPVTVIDERFRFDPALPSLVERTIREIEPDIVQSHHVKSHALVAQAARGATPWIAFHHGYTDTDLKTRLYNKLDRWSLPRADAIVTTCRPFANQLVAIGVPRERISVLHNGVVPRTGMSRRLARERLRLGDERVVFTAGRLSREKGHDVLVDACARLDAGLRERLTLLICGRGPERERLEARAAASGVRLRMEGHQADLDPYYAAADVFVLPSRSEGSPNVLLEAFASECAVVATRVGGVPEIADDGVSALLVESERADAMRDAIQRLFASPDCASVLRQGARLAASRFTPDARAEKLLSVYDGVLPHVDHSFALPVISPIA